MIVLSNCKQKVIHMILTAVGICFSYGFIIAVGGLEFNHLFITSGEK
jgi:hypothetical protein